MAIGLDEFAEGGDQAPNATSATSSVRRRVGDHDVVVAGVVGVDVIVANAKDGDDFKLRKT
jgi:hypothetical protein